MRNRTRDDIDQQKQCSSQQVAELGLAEECLENIKARLSQDPTLELSTQPGGLIVYTATAIALLRPVLLNRAGLGGEGVTPAITVRVIPIPWLAWIDTPRSRATWLNRGIGLGAIQGKQKYIGDTPPLKACFELNDGIGWERDGAALLRLFATAGGD